LSENWPKLYQPEQGPNLPAEELLRLERGADYGWPAGIYCTVDLQIPRKSPSLLIPANAIIFNRDGLQVAVVENDVAHIRKISVARDLGTQVEVRDGLKAGDQVILNPTVDLMDGNRVRPRTPAK
jgi:multidrug efflux pump subunit AcrA (membrane-fusion protein)